jgi:hypothetical protein
MMNIKYNLSKRQRGHKYLWILLLSGLLLAGCNTAVKESPLAQDLDVDTANLGNAVMRINVGASSATTINGVRWEADRDFGGNTQTYRTSSRIVGTDSQQLYQTGRTTRGTSSFWYFLNVEPGDYLVRMHFAEPEFQSAGRRVFDVSVPGANRLRRLDVFREVGRHRALTKDFELTTRSSRITIYLPASAGRPILSGIEVFEKSSSSNSGSTPPPSAGSSGSTNLSLRANPNFRESNLPSETRRWYRRFMAAINNSQSRALANDTARRGDLSRMGRTVDTYVTSILTVFRVTGDPKLLDEVDRVMQLARGSLKRDNRGYLYWPWLRDRKHRHYGTDNGSFDLDRQLTHGVVAMAAYTFQVNANLNSRYRERANFWTNYLKNHFEKKHRERRGIRSGFPFMVSRMTHAYVSWTRYHYYMHKLTGERGYLNEAQRMAEVLNRQMVTVNGGSAYVWDHFVTREPHNRGTQFANSYGCQHSTYARYTMHGLQDLANEGFSVFNNAFMRRVAGTLRDNIMNGTNSFSRDVCGGRNMGSLRSRHGGNDAANFYVGSPFTELAAWDSSGKIARIAEGAYRNREQWFMEKPRNIFIPAAMVFQLSR